MMKLKYNSMVFSCQSQPGKSFYYFATCALLLLLIDKPYGTPANGLRLYLRRWKRVCKLLFAQFLCIIFKYVDKYYQTK